jgi:hypothetical protein
VASSARGDLLEAWDEYQKVFGTDGPPSTLLGAASLGRQEQLVEIEAVAVQDWLGGEQPPGSSQRCRALALLGTVRSPRSKPACLRRRRRSLSPQRVARIWRSLCDEPAIGDERVPRPDRRSSLVGLGA